MESGKPAPIGASACVMSRPSPLASVVLPRLPTAKRTFGAEPASASSEGLGRLPPALPPPSDSPLRPRCRLCRLWRRA